MVSPYLADMSSLVSTGVTEEPVDVPECDPEVCESDVPTCREDQTLVATRADGSCCLAHICSQSRHTQLMKQL